MPNGINQCQSNRHFSFWFISEFPNGSIPSTRKLNSLLWEGIPKTSSNSDYKAIQGRSSVCLSAVLSTWTIAFTNSRRWDRLSLTWMDLVIESVLKFCFDKTSNEKSQSSGLGFKILGKFSVSDGCDRKQTSLSRRIHTKFNNPWSKFTSTTTSIWSSFPATVMFLRRR